MYFLLLWVLTLGLLLPGCQDEDPIPMTQTEVTFLLPEKLIGADLGELQVTFENINTATTVTAPVVDNRISVTLEDGIYTILVAGKVYRKANVEGATIVRGQEENRIVEKGNMSLQIELFIVEEATGWVFKELYFTGSQTPEGKSYYKDKYFELYNNSDKVLYADGLSVCESDHSTATALNAHAEWVDAFAVVATIYTIPGSGKEYPVQPGRSLVLADVGMNHKEVNSNSYDLTIADFEWFDNHRLDVDVPEVPNLIRHFSYSASIWTPHNRGYKSYLLFKPEVSMEAYLTNYKYEYTSISGNEISRYKVPNEWVLDAVECSTPSNYQSKAFSPRLDLSYINCGDGDASRYGKCVRRKVKTTTAEGRVVYADTNDSANDFLSTVEPQPKVFQ